MSDKPLVQQALASELAELILTISSTAASLAFIRGFWEMTVREWNGIDRLRYVFLQFTCVFSNFLIALTNIICSYAASLTPPFAFLSERDGARMPAKNTTAFCPIKGDPCGELYFMESTYEDLIFFSPCDSRVPASLAYHIADIYIEELDKALGTATSPQPAPLATILEPFFYLAARTPTTTTYKRIQLALLEPLLNALASETDLEDDPPKAKRIRLSSDTPTFLKSNACLEDPELDGRMEGVILKKRLLRRIFEIASQPETRDSNRRKMYALWKEGVEDDSADDE